MPILIDQLDCQSPFQTFKFHLHGLIANARYTHLSALVLLHSLAHSTTFQILIPLTTSLHAIAHFLLFSLGSTAFLEFLF